MADFIAGFKFLIVIAIIGIFQDIFQNFGMWVFISLEQNCHPMAKDIPPYYAVAFIMKL